MMDPQALIASEAGPGSVPLLPGHDRACTVYRLGCLSYTEGLRIQADLVARRKAQQTTDSLLLLEHFPVITCGRNSHATNVLSSPEALRREGIELVQTNRGGDVTFHGPGQLVVYPILWLEKIRKDVVWYVRTLEEVVLRALGDIGVSAFRTAGLTGVWVSSPNGPAKVAAIGVHISRWVTSHGLALNLDTDLRYFRHIVPCGIARHPVTSVREILGRSVERRLLERSLVQHFGELFNLEMVEASSQSLQMEAV